MTRGNNKKVAQKSPRERKVKETILLEVNSPEQLIRTDEPIGRVKKYGKEYLVYSNIKSL